MPVRLATRRAITLVFAKKSANMTHRPANSDKSFTGKAVWTKTASPALLGSREENLANEKTVRPSRTVASRKGNGTCMPSLLATPPIRT